MQRLVWTEQQVKGPAKNPTVQKPFAAMGYYRDEATLAFPTPASDAVTMTDQLAGISCQGLDADALRAVVDGEWGTRCAVPVDKKVNLATVDFEFKTPFAARDCFLFFGPGPFPSEVDVLVSDDGRTFRSVGKRSKIHSPAVAHTLFNVELDGSPGRFIRLQMKGAGRDLVLNEVRFSSGYRLPAWDQDALHILSPSKPYANPAEVPDVPAGAAIDPKSIVDLTGKLDANGVLDWTVPAGDWTIMRFGHTTTTMENRPGGADTRGLETDKFSKEATAFHFQNMLGVVAERAGELTGKTLGFTHVDSWEVGTQNWSKDFAAEFETSHSYSPRSWLPAMTGRVVGSPAASERFLWDVRRTVADLLADNYFGALRTLCHEKGMKLTLQADGPPGDDPIHFARRADATVANAWPDEKLLSRNFQRAKWNSSAAHLEGMKVTTSEALTSPPESARWTDHPFLLKPFSDQEFSAGVNHQTLHVYIHQPFTNVAPGLTLNHWGIHFNRNLTWWKQSRPWLEYLRRAQFLLQQGRFAADVICFQGDGEWGVPNLQKLRSAGYDYDLCDAETILKGMSVDESGDVVLPSGMRYRLLALKKQDRMRPELLRKIHQLVKAGATLMGARPEYSPSLENYPACDAEVRRLADELWGPIDGKTMMENRVGKGRVLADQPIEVALQKTGIKPDFLWKSDSGKPPVNWSHRTVDGTEVYFVANPTPDEVSGRATFRVSGRQPELWHPETGKRSLMTGAIQTDGTTAISLTLNPVESVFVVFPQKPTTADVSGFKFRVSDSSDLPGPWQVAFQPGRGAPAAVELPELIDWSKHPDDGVKFFSGTATYRTEFEWKPEPSEARQTALGSPKGESSSQTGNRKPEICLDLGQVREIAEVRLNGKSLGILWKPPFRVEITDAVKAGKNRLEIEVTNLWPNRMIGDERMFPPDAKFDQRPGYAGGGLAEWPEWLLKNQPRPTGRITFSTWKHWTAKDELLPSGLIGPVRLQQAEGTKQ